jgi:uncharacterized protein (TIGR01777 family)
MRVAVTGATGLIGAATVRALRARGDDVIALSRDPRRSGGELGAGVELQAWPDPKQAPPPAAALEHADAVIHLLGEPVAQRWSESAKREIRESRVLATRSLVTALRGIPAPARPRVLVSQSATGYYGSLGDEPVDESTPPGSDFLAAVTAEWEAEANKLEGSARVVTPRTGVVLAQGGGALEKMLPPFRLGIGGPVGGGAQYVPWVHLDDVVGAILHCLDHEDAAGPVNLTAPNPVTNRELSHTLGRVLHRPAVLPVPAAALRLLYGEMATIILGGARVIPGRLGELGYTFQYAELEPALRDVLSA